MLAALIISHLKSISAQHYILDKLVADNMSFESAEMQNFASRLRKPMA